MSASRGKWHVRQVHNDARRQLSLGLIEKNDHGLVFCPPYDDIYLVMYLRAT